MWMIFVREPRPLARVWPGREMLGVVDAVAWPMAGIALVTQWPDRGQITGQFLIALLVLLAIGRTRRAWFDNENYHFTTWRWGRVALLMMAVGALLRLVAVR